MKTTDLTTLRTVIGPCKGKPHSRIWLEGERPRLAGFEVAARYDRTEEAGGIVLRLNPAGKYKVSKAGAAPVIDIIGGIIERVFPLPVTHVTARFAQGCITISAS